MAHCFRLFAYEAFQDSVRLAKATSEGFKPNIQKINKCSKTIAKKTTKKDIQFMKSELKLLRKYPYPTKLKRPLPPFASFFVQKMNGLGNIGAPEKMKILGREWKQLPEETKKKYQPTEQAKEEYLKKKEMYQNIHGRKKWLKYLKKMMKQKPPIINGYAGFIKEKFKEHKTKNPNSKLTEVAKILAEDWKKLSHAEKTRWHRKYLQPYEKWKKELNKYYE